ncbi:cytosine/adenosine deaminase-related metal-dependent hydrolase [Herbihabitans rhizosphaerae]|uniref:Cytosine/adenosine deaminase-related metal-dependent hydrolase n=1 Tax=Herbihabitans rhizosphaerae TaxID=1872711 RepID=A0A4Q7L711_9PSEU|nr:amidohydrolase family protein [Herbihabitans rhizosphaerae]RZS45165.1 cytosine/adenosine deaminase-related metal-dependent hydrolase [Herbihabitans rhizosphaerae]
MTTDRTLLHDALVIDTEPEPVARPHTDVLIEGDTIAAVGPDLPSAGATVIDCTDRIVLPGFVDTHRHTWQAVLRGIAVDIDLGTYIDLVPRTLAQRFRPSDVYAGTLAGALECLDAGVTTLFDFSHIQNTPEHTDAAVAALRASGIRALFGYGYPFTGEAADHLAGLRRARRELFAEPAGLVTLAAAPHGPSYTPIEVVEQDWRHAREHGIRITVHIGRGPVAARPVEALRERGLLGPDVTFVHGNDLADDELRMIADTGGSMAVTPAVEAQMGHGAPTLGRLRAAGVTTGLGVDVVTTVAGDMFTLMRAALLTSQLDGRPCTASDVLRLATLDGAAAIGMADEVGSLRPGKRADVVLLRADAVNLAGGRHDPIATVVTSAHPGNVDTVLVGGRPVKRDGLLLTADLAGALTAAGASADRLAAA